VSATDKIPGNAPVSRTILLDHVTKLYPGQAKPAVAGLTLEIPAGKIVMLVGPSGCGKTTTLKMINRLIEPSSGRIMLGDEDVTALDGDELRRRMGYVIQAGGLFPHMTVAANIAIVPKMLGWSKVAISRRVDELLDLVSLDPGQYRNRYPRELSGGQQQRVGVARALAADPPVLLMDEPFGAVDPITRQRLQDELLRIQEAVRKTIVFVTHDFDEAVKLGDWIAIFSEGARIVQYDSPARILAQPANAFVRDFIGEGAGFKRLTLNRVRDLTLAEAVTAMPGERGTDVLARLKHAGGNHAVIIDQQRRPLNWLSRDQLACLETITESADPQLTRVTEEATLSEALDTMLASGTGAALVVDRGHACSGVITFELVMASLSRSRAATTSADNGAPIGSNTDLDELAAAPYG
jgi:osmoprotectant transport system ATP-binding protein